MAFNLYRGLSFSGICDTCSRSLVEFRHLNKTIAGSASIFIRFPERKKRKTTMNKPNPTTKKLVKMESALLFTFIALIIGFLGGIVFSAFRMENSPMMPTAVVDNRSQSEQSVSDEHAAHISELEKAVAETPEDAIAWIDLGNAYFDHNLPEKAIHAYETALKFQPDNANVWTDLGVMYRRSDRPEKAIAAFDKAQDVDPEHQVSLLNKGIVQMHDLDDSAGAADTWSKLLDINPLATTQSGMLVKDLVEALKVEHRTSNVQ